MTVIHLLDEPTINKIAAGEVVERPSAVVKELVENAMDAGASAITVEIKEGGLSFMRITDNGSGMNQEDIPLAFMRHATSKIRTAEDLLSVTSLGFRGEALSSIAAVAQIELITKTRASISGCRYLIEGGSEKSIEEIGCPSGTTIIVRNLFFNTPARRKFLKSPITEAGYISDLMERLMVSHPSVSFKYIINNQVKLQSSGNNNSRDILYQVYGRDMVKELLEVSYDTEEIRIHGYVGKPSITRGNRNYENYFINERYIKNPVITKAIEDAYKPYLMQHKYPFVSLYYGIDPMVIDVNVHPQKKEIRLRNGEEVYRQTVEAIRKVLTASEMIPKVVLTQNTIPVRKPEAFPEPFEDNRRKRLGIGSEAIGSPLPKDGSETNMIQGPEVFSEAIGDTGHTGTSPEIGNHEKRCHAINGNSQEALVSEKESLLEGRNTFDSNSTADNNDIVDNKNATNNSNSADNGNSAGYGNTLGTQGIKVSSYLREGTDTGDQLSLFENGSDWNHVSFLSKDALKEHRIIGQLFSTYWLVEYRKELYIIDQHAAHEKVLYEKLMSAARSKGYEAQLLMPPIVLTLTLREQEVLHKYQEYLTRIGYEIEPFGGNEYSVRAVPANLYHLQEKELLLEFIDDLSEEISVNTPELILERVASLSCKAAVKANHTLSREEARALIEELLTLENPYNCPHGRPVIISMSQYELERKFKRIV